MSKYKIKSKKSYDENVGAEFYFWAGKIFSGCAVISLILLGFVLLLPQDREKYNIPLITGIWILLSLAVLLLGMMLMTLSKKSVRFQTWAEKDVMDYAERLIKKG